jgi:hypothetical protein
MRAIGFRVEPKAIHYAVVEGSVDEPIVVSTDKFSAPKTYSEGAKLVWYRKRILSELEEHEVERVGIRFPEAGSKGAGTSSAMWRLRIEGVTMEAVASMSLPICAAGGVQHIRAKLGSSHSPKDYMSGLVELRGIQLSDYRQNIREAILIAVAALEGEAE